MERDYAIVVGITEYPQLPALQGPERDADDVYAWLVAGDGGDVPPGNVEKIVTSRYKDNFEDGKPTADLVDAAFMKLVRLGRKNEGQLGRRLYIYFSGHGIAPDLDLDEAALLMANAARDMPGLHIPGRLYANSIKAEGLFEEVVLLMDCCRDDYERVSKRTPPWIPVPTVRGGNTRHLYGFATRWALKAREKPIHQGQVNTEKGVYRGVFTTALLEALWGHNADEQRRVTGRTVSGHVHSRVGELLQEKEFVKPQFDFDVNDDIVLVEQVAQAPGPKQVVVVITPASTAPVELVGPGAQKRQFPAASGRHVLELEPGFYVLREQGTNREVGFPVLGEGSAHVEL